MKPWPKGVLAMIYRQALREEIRRRRRTAIARALDNPIGIVSVIAVIVWGICVTLGFVDGAVASLPAVVSLESESALGTWKLLRFKEGFVSGLRWTAFLLPVLLLQTVLAPTYWRTNWLERGMWTVVISYFLVMHLSALAWYMGVAKGLLGDPHLITEGEFERYSPGLSYWVLFVLCAAIVFPIRSIQNRAAAALKRSVARRSQSSS